MKKKTKAEKPKTVKPVAIKSLASGEIKKFMRIMQRLYERERRLDVLARETNDLARDEFKEVQKKTLYRHKGAVIVVPESANRYAGMRFFVESSEFYSSGPSDGKLRWEWIFHGFPANKDGSPSRASRKKWFVVPFDTRIKILKESQNEKEDKT